VPLPYGDMPTVYHLLALSVEAERREHRFSSDFWLSDGRGRIRVAPERGTSLCRASAPPNQAALDDWLDRGHLEHDSCVPASQSATLEMIQPGDAVVVVGNATADRHTDGLVLRVRFDDPESLLFADGSLDAVLERLAHGPRRTLRWLAAGVALLAMAVVLLLIEG
jgi:hypothetical protein